MSFENIGNYLDTLSPFLAIIGTSIGIIIALYKFHDRMKESISREFRTENKKLCTQINNVQTTVSSHLRYQDKGIEEIKKKTESIDNEVNDLRDKFGKHIQISEQQIGQFNVRFENHELRIDGLEEIVRKKTDQLRDKGVK